MELLFVIPVAWGQENDDEKWDEDLIKIENSYFQLKRRALSFEERRKGEALQDLVLSATGVHFRLFIEEFNSKQSGRIIPPAEEISKVFHGFYLSLQAELLQRYEKEQNHRRKIVKELQTLSDQFYFSFPFTEEPSDTELVAGALFYARGEGVLGGYLRKRFSESLESPESSHDIVALLFLEEFDGKDVSEKVRKLKGVDKRVVASLRNLYDAYSLKD